MGTPQSSLDQGNMSPPVAFSKGSEMLPESVRGRKSIPTSGAIPDRVSSVVSVDTAFEAVMVDAHEFATVDEEDEASVTDVSSYTEEDTDDEDDEEDEAWEERLRILEDARNLKKVAEHFLHPEKSVETDNAATARCFFDRPSAGLDDVDAEEKSAVLEDLAALKKLAGAYQHPEKAVEVEATATARCVFDRPSAPERLSADEAEARAQVLADLAAVKKLATDYLHPEAPVEADGFASARCFFDRYSASEENADRELALSDAAALKQAAFNYRHPETPVVATDPTAYGRNYFNRASAVDPEEEERARVLQECADMKKLARAFMHPEDSVVVSDPNASGRNYFSRYSAAEQDCDVEETTGILEDAAKMRQIAADFLHPETPVVPSDPTAFGRNYFGRASALSQVESDDILQDALALKKLAVDFRHPEVPVVTSDPTSFGRNYFGRASAQVDDDSEERARVLGDCALLKRNAEHFAHPEVPVVMDDPSACGRNFFCRGSAPNNEDAVERTRVLEDAAKLGELAKTFAHPETRVLPDPMVFGRNYFGRASAELPDEEEEAADERARVLADAQALKKFAVDYLHPENPVDAVDPTLTSRCYFERPSAKSPEEDDETEERARVLADAQALKKFAVDYLHPENPVEAVDPTLTSRCYFERPSAKSPEDDDEAEERARVLADAQALKKSAVDYLHPEKPIEAVDPAQTSRCYFERASAELPEGNEAEEHARILADAVALKKLAVDYLHPENLVETTDSSGTARCYFDRASALVHHQMIHTFPADPHHEEHNHEHLDHFGMDEDMVVATDDIRKDLAVPASAMPKENVDNSSEEGKLSRSPSSVMLFTEEANSE